MPTTTVSPGCMMKLLSMIPPRAPSGDRHRPHQSVVLPLHRLVLGSCIGTQLHRRHLADVDLLLRLRQLHFHRHELIPEIGALAETQPRAADGVGRLPPGRVDLVGQCELTVSPCDEVFTVSWNPY